MPEHARPMQISIADPLTYFTDRAQSYDTHRPRYAADAFETMVAGMGDPASLAATDIGCGTGIATRQLAALGVDVLGIEPNEQMRVTARALSSDATASRYQHGTAEQTGLPDGAVDLVLCAQAFHWFDAASALREFHRILKPGNGRLALLWNVRDNTDPIVADYDRIMTHAHEAAHQAGRITRRHRSFDLSDYPTLFANITIHRFDNPHQLDFDGLLGRAKSASYFPLEGPIYDRLEQKLRDFHETHQQADGTVTLAQTTKLTLARRVEP